MSLTLGSFLFCFAHSLANAQGTQPIVAVHDSEYTRGLENQNATAGTPAGTGKQWWPTDWHYFVMPESAKELLRSDGTAFTTVGDSNIIAGDLLTNGLPKYPIVISLASEAIRDNEIAAFTNYVAAGGFLFVGSSSFTRNTNGTSRGDFAFANEMGIHMFNSALTNWAQNSTISKTVDHRLVTHIPNGTYTWRLPASSEEIPFGTSPTHNISDTHDIWMVVSSNATVIAQGNNFPYLLVKQYGKGYFIYCSAMQPLICNGGYGPGMYAYLILRRSIEWAFESAKRPVVKLSPWPYAYDAALMVRHDLEHLSNLVANIEASAQYEFTNGAKGDYYFCTGTLRDDMRYTYDTNAVVASLRRAITNYGATIGPHNGGLRNPGNPALIAGDYDYWHWGTDEALDTSPPGYANGKAYAQASMLTSFQNIESWLGGLMTNGMRVWCSPYFNATREQSLEIQSNLNVKITGERKLSPFPQWTFSTGTAGRRYPILSQPASEWYGGTLSSQVAQSLEYHTSQSMRAGVDFYYNLGALVNFYSHALSSGQGTAGAVAAEYVTYAMNTNLHPRLWSANAIGIYQWWLQRSNVQVTASYSTNGSQSIATLAVKNSTHTNTSVEVLVDGANPPCSIQVYTNGVLTGSDRYRVNGQLIKVRAGTTVTNVSVRYYPSSPVYELFSQKFDAITAPALPTGWTTTFSGSQAAWFTQNTNVNTSPNAASVGEAAATGSSELVSPPITLPSGSAQLIFAHSYNLEAEPGNTIGDDGGVLEIKIGAGTFTDIITAGGSFVTEGYNRTISSSFGSPIAGHPAWSGDSGGFVTTTVNLPASASGQTIQLRWRCVTDTGTGGGGWRVDSIALYDRFCYCCVSSTNAPVLPAQSDMSVLELDTLTVTNTASDADASDLLYYSLMTAPTGATISTNGVITWIPSSAYGNTTNIITTVVVDSGGLAATNSFQVIVINVNSGPVFPAPANRSIAEATTLNVTNRATDLDVPPDAFTYSLLAAPPGATISSTGVITWPTTETEGPDVYTFTTRVVDDGVPPMASTNSFTVTVNEVNSPPTLQGQPDRTVDELGTIIVTNVVSDSDIPANTFTYQLINPPSGATINSSGVITWTPNGLVGPVTNTIQTVVTDSGSPAMRATNTFSVTVNDVATCQYAVGFLENFDSVAPTNLPPGWTSTTSGGQVRWVTQSPISDTPTNSAYGAETVNIGSSELVSPAIAIPSSGSILSFHHTYDMETNTSTVCFDGGVLEIRIGAGSFQDIIAAGGSFAAGGYTHTIISGTGNPIPNRQAWSGNSGGFVTSAVSLPPSALGQNVQLRWRCVTDNGVGGSGWHVDSISISNFVCVPKVSAPALPGQANIIVPEATLLTVTNTATDTNIPASTLTYQLIGAPAGAAIDTNGVITWTPTEAQGPGTNTIVTVANNGSSSATNSFIVMVTEVNSAPSIEVQTNRFIAELTTLIVTNGATDTDIPANVLSYQLINPPAGASISPAGVITWSPTEAQGPDTRTIVTVVSDGMASVTNSFDVTVTEVNTTPSLGIQTNRTIAELTTLIVTNGATDTDIPANTLSYQLINPPAGASISPAGVITWTPTEEQGPDARTIVTVASDGVLSVTNTFNVSVTEVNTAPSMGTQTNRTIAELTALIVTNAASDSDIPANNLSYQLINPPAGASISAAGVITWTPTEEQGPDAKVIVTVVSDGILSATNSFTVAVTESNVAPTLPAQSNISVMEQSLLTVTNTATDADVPANTLSYQLINPPVGAGISPAGVITWTPTEEQSPDITTIVTVVSDGTSSVTNSFVVTVMETNSPPVLASQTNRTIVELGTLIVTNAAMDSDIPANALTYQLIGPPTGAVIDASGVITWTPTEEQGPYTNELVTVVNDGVSSVTNSFTVIVTEANVAPTLPAQLNVSIPEQTPLIVTNTATDADFPANILSYQLVNPPAGANISADGVITWTPNEAEGPDSITIVTVVSDGTLSATNSFLVTVTEVNTVPSLGVQTNRTIAELTTLIVTNAATDSDIPANTLSYQLINPPAGASISAVGVITWTPAEEQGADTRTIVTVASDGVLSITNSFAVTVTESNVAPSLPTQSDVSIPEQTLLIVTNTATDTDFPANVLIYQLINPPAGASISAAGVITWTPTEHQGPGTNQLVTIVDDGLSSVTNSFTVIVTEANTSPLLSAQSDISIPELSVLTLTNAAMDSDIPVNALSYQLINPPAGMVISENGVITWTPAEDQGPSTNTITTVVSDGALTATNSFQLIVTEVNTPPALAGIANRVIHAGDVIVLHCLASDPDGGANHLSFNLAGTPPAGVTVGNTNGILSWQTTDADANTTNNITVQVVDDGAPPLGDSKSFTVTVVSRPQLQSIVVTNDVATITWTSIAGQHYRLQSATGLTSPNWSDVGLDVTAVGNAQSQTNSVTGSQQKFYRVRLAP